MPRGRKKKEPETAAKRETPVRPTIDFSSISLVIPCYWVNQELIEATERCLLSLAESNAQISDLIIVDDGSSSGMRPDPYFLKRANARIVTVEANRGYTIAVNRGLAAAKGDIIIVGNNDLLFTKGWLEALLEPLQTGYDLSSLTAIEPKKPFDGSPRIISGERFGSLFAMKRYVLTELEGLDEDLGRGYFTDLDFQKRAQDAGFKDGRSYKVAVHHIPKSTFKVVDPEDKMYIEAKAAFIKKWGKLW